MSEVTYLRTGEYEITARVVREGKPYEQRLLLFPPSHDSDVRNDPVDESPQRRRVREVLSKLL